VGEGDYFCHLHSVDAIRLDGFVSGGGCIDHHVSCGWPHLFVVEGSGRDCDYCGEGTWVGCFAHEGNGGPCCRVHNLVVADGWMKFCDAMEHDRCVGHVVDRQHGKRGVGTEDGCMVVRGGSQCVKKCGVDVSGLVGFGKVVDGGEAMTGGGERAAIGGSSNSDDHPILTPTPGQW